MPRNTTHFNWVIPVATDLYNQMTLGNPAIEAIDTQAFKNQNTGVQPASHTRLGTVHALVRDIKSAPVIRFVATENYHALDTFTVDGESVSAKLCDGTALAEGCFKTGNNVLCIMGSGVLTVFAVGSAATTAKRLENPVNIGSASFDGSEAITLEDMGAQKEIKFKIVPQSAPVVVGNTRTYTLQIEVIPAFMEIGIMAEGYAELDRRVVSSIEEFRYCASYNDGNLIRNTLVSAKITGTTLKIEVTTVGGGTPPSILYFVKTAQA